MARKAKLSDARSWSPGRSERQRTALIIGASSGIGEAVARRLGSEGWRLGLAARRVGRLEALARELGGDCLIAGVDLVDLHQATPALGVLLERLGTVDLCVITAGVGFLNPGLDWATERITIEVNTLGFAAAANLVLKLMIERGSGTLVGVSSVAAAGEAGWRRPMPRRRPLPLCTSMGCARTRESVRRVSGWSRLRPASCAGRCSRPSAHSGSQRPRRPPRIWCARPREEGSLCDAEMATDRYAVAPPAKAGLSQSRFGNAPGERASVSASIMQLVTPIRRRSSFLGRSGISRRISRSSVRWDTELNIYFAPASDPGAARRAVRQSLWAHRMYG
jgi:NAD(P)-dependent dehydrogenase (short-subunit alcohol dehydrogenase family)